jgi:hypothetical protein
MGMSTAWATGPGFGNESVGRHCIARSGPPFPTAQAPLHPESLLNLTESGSLAESSPSATKPGTWPGDECSFPLSARCRARARRRGIRVAA